MDRKQKLELTWIGKYDEIKVEPRILLEDKSKGYGDQNTENMLIHGDNLLALKALEQDFAGKIKYIYIDPPYNTGSAFAHYDDNLEHSTWLNLMKPRLEIIHNLLADDGSLWISIDDDECHYLKVLCDEIFGRRNFVANVIWEKSSLPKTMLNGYQIVMTIFCFTLKTRIYGILTNCLELLIWTKDIKILIMIQGGHGHLEIYQ